MSEGGAPPDSDLLGLYVAGIAGLYVIALLLAFFLVGPVVGIAVLLVGGALAALLIYRMMR